MRQNPIMFKSKHALINVLLLYLGLKHTIVHKAITQDGIKHFCRLPNKWKMCMNSRKIECIQCRFISDNNI